MKTFQKMIVIEKAELELTMRDMIHFMESKEFNHIRDIDKRLMRDQLFYMNKYKKILEKRINNFEFSTLEDL